MRGMRPDDVYELTWVADPRLDPTGRRVAYVVSSLDRETNQYRGSLWLAAVDGAEPARQLTDGYRDGSPRWSPDGTRIAFVGKLRDGDEGQLYVVPAAGGEPQRLTELEEDVSEPAWSPDGTRVAFTSRVRAAEYDEEDDRGRRPRRITRLAYKLDDVGWTFDRPQQLFVVAADGSSDPVQLTHGEHQSSAPAWAPDGARIAFVSARGEDWDIDLVSDVWVMSADGSDQQPVTTADGSCEGPAWSPDGTRIAYRWAPERDDFPRHTQIAVVDLASGERRVLTASLDRNCGPYPPIRSETLWDGERIVFALEDRGNVHVHEVAADGSSRPKPLVGGELAVSGYDAHGETLVHVASTATSSRELFAGERRLTDVGRAFLEGRELVEPERFTAISKDGTEVDAWLVRPAGFEPGTTYPVLLNVHGGPFSQYGSGFFDEFQVQAGAGYAVLYSNPRGSSGYSEEWGRAIMGPIRGGPGWGTVDYEDVTAVVDTALARFDFLDGERLGVLGGSYGGFMTSWIVSHTNRFKAACSERAVNHLLSAYGSSDLFWVFGRHFGGFPSDDVEAYLRHSPATYAQQIETPLLIVHSEDDLRCDVEQAEHLFITLRLQRKPVEFVRFPAEGHELSRTGSPAHRTMRFEILLDWFGRYL